MKHLVRRAESDDAREVAVLVGELNSEIMAAIGARAFRFEHGRIMDERIEFLEQADYAVLIASSLRGHPLGFVTLFESFTHHADGPFCIIAELYVRKEYRRRGIGHRLIEQAKSYARSRRCRRLQLTMPEFVHLEAAFSFFKSERFIDSGGSKLKLTL